MNDTTTPPADAAAATEPGELAGLKARIAEMEKQAAAAKDQHLRAVAELDNVRKRAEREAANTARYGAEKLLAELLAICDSLELGLKAAITPGANAQSISDGLGLTHRQLLSLLEKHGVKPVDPQGQPFNPELHEAVSALESADVAPNHVMNVMQKGYRLHERLLRPAMVVVARAPAVGL